MARALIPNSTQVPDFILDHLMAELSGAEFKVLMYIARRTYGFGKESDRISLAQIAQGIVRRDGTVLDRGTGSSRSSVARSLKSLEERGLIIRETNLSESGREFVENTYRINLDCERASGPGGGPGRGHAPEGSEQGGVVSTRDHLVSTTDPGRSQGGATVVSKRHPQETGPQETGQETAAAQGRATPRVPEGDAAAGLLDELVRNGVGRAAAEELARNKPRACRLYLDYLPFADIRSSRGAWLANAIRDEYGPPARYLTHQASQRTPESPRESPADSEVSTRATGALYARMVESAPEALAAFTAFLEASRERTMRFAAGSLGLRSGEALLEALGGEEYRLSQFSRWLREEGARYAQPQPGVRSGGPQSSEAYQGCATESSRSSPVPACLRPDSVSGSAASSE